MEFEGARPGIPAAIRDPGVVAIGRRLDADSVATIADGLVAGGVRAFELTLNDPVAGALASIEALAHRFAESDLLVGAGTVMSIAAEPTPTISMENSATIRCMRSTTENILMLELETTISTSAWAPRTNTWAVAETIRSS